MEDRIIVWPLSSLVDKISMFDAGLENRDPSVWGFKHCTDLRTRCYWERKACRCFNWL